MAKRSGRKAGAEGRGLSVNRFNNEETDLERKKQNYRLQRTVDRRLRS